MKILIVKLSSLGDVISSMVVLQYIKQKHPEAEIDWLVDVKFSKALEDNPDINQIHTVSLKKHRKNIFKIILEVRQKIKELKNYDLIIDMQGLMKSAFISRFVGKNIIGFDKKSAKEGLSALFYSKKVRIAFSEHILKRNIALINDALGVNVSYEEMMDKKPYLHFKPPQVQLGDYLSTNSKNVLIILGGSWASKLYPKELVKEVIKKLKQNCLLLWSSEEEHQRALWIQRQTKFCTVLPKMSLNDVKALVSHVDVIVGNDTGPTHMAWALNKPSVTILGCTSITRIPQTGTNLIVTSKSCVNPCKIDKDDLSIAEIPPYEVVDAVSELLELPSIQPPPKT